MPKCTASLPGHDLPSPHSRRPLPLGCRGRLAGKYLHGPGHRHRDRQQLEDFYALHSEVPANQGRLLIQGVGKPEENCEKNLV